MPDLPRLGAATWLEDLPRLPGLRRWLDGRDVEIRDFTTLGALTGDRWRDLAAQVAREFPNHSGVWACTAPFLA